MSSTVRFVKTPIIPNLVFSSRAYARLLLLMGSTHAKAKEFGFLGLVSPIGPDYLVMDFKLIPQEQCSGTYWESDDNKYPEWLAKNILVDMRKYLRLHGHSHVNMGTSPSGTDAQQIKQMFDSVSDFFIQFICNHKMENTINIWDKKQGLIFENVDQYVLIGNTRIKLNNINSTSIYKNYNKNINLSEVQSVNDYLKINETIFLNLSDLSVNIVDEYLAYNSKTGIILTDNSKTEAPNVEKQFKECIKTTYTYNYNYQGTQTSGKTLGLIDDYDDYDDYFLERNDKNANWEEFQYWGVLTEEEKEYLRENDIYGHEIVRAAIAQYRTECLAMPKKKKKGRPKKVNINESK